MPNYTKTNWVNNSAPAINADNLNKIEAGIKANADSINEFIANSSPLGDSDVIKCVTSDGVNLADQANAVAGKALNTSNGAVVTFPGGKLLPLIRIPWEKYNDGQPKTIIISTSTSLNTASPTALRFCRYDKNLKFLGAGGIANAAYTTPDGSTRYVQRALGNKSAPSTPDNCYYLYVSADDPAFEGNIQVEVQTAKSNAGYAVIAQESGANYEALNGQNIKVLDNNIIIDSIPQVPAQDKTYVLKCVNGVITWVEEV